MNLTMRVLSLPETIRENAARVFTALDIEIEDKERLRAHQRLAVLLLVRSIMLPLHAFCGFNPPFKKEIDHLMSSIQVAIL